MGPLRVGASSYRVRFSSQAKRSQRAMEEVAPVIRLYGTRGSAAAYAIRDFLHRGDVPFKWIELRSDGEARSAAQADGLDDECLPICLFPDGTRLEHPT